MLHAHCLIYTAFNFELCKPWKKLMKEKSFVMQKPLINKNENMNFTRFSRMLFVLKKNTIVKRKNIEIIFWSSTKPFAFKCITQAQRTVYLFTAAWQQACASGKAMKTGDADFLANRPFWCNILCILPDPSLRSSIYFKIHY